VPAAAVRLLTIELPELLGIAGTVQRDQLEVHQSAPDRRRLRLKLRQVRNLESSGR